MKIESLDIALLAVLLASALATVLTARVLRAALALALASAILAVLLYRLGASLAAVFELSVCAGLIPAIFISAIGMTRRLAGEDLAERRRQTRRHLVALPLVLAAAGVLLAIWRPELGVMLPGPSGEDVREVLWQRRHADLLGQVAVLLAGAMAVVVLVKELRSAPDSHD